MTTMTTGPEGGAKKPNWTKQEESKIRRIFKQCDADGNGAVSIGELFDGLSKDKSLARTLGIPAGATAADSPELAEIFAGLDTDGNAELDFEEFGFFFAERASVLRYLPLDGANEQYVSLEETMTKLEGKSAELTAAFEEKSSALAPVDGLREALVKALPAVVGKFLEPAELIPEGKRIGKTFAKSGTDAETVAAYNAALVQAIESLAGENSEAWAAAMTNFNDMLKLGFEESAREDAEAAEEAKKKAAEAKAAAEAAKKKADEEAKAAAEAAKKAADEKKKAEQEAAKAEQESAKTAAEAAKKKAEEEAKATEAVDQAAAEEAQKKAEEEAKAAKAAEEARKKAEEEAKAAAKAAEEKAAEEEARKKAAEEAKKKAEEEAKAAAEAAKKAEEEAKAKAAEVAAAEKKRKEEAEKFALEREKSIAKKAKEDAQKSEEARAADEAKAAEAKAAAEAAKAKRAEAEAKAATTVCCGISLPFKLPFF